MSYTILPHRGLVALSGEDAPHFLQGLISNDINKLNAGNALYTALLSPQGKFLHDFFLIRRGEAIWLDADRAQLPDLLARLRLYKLRSKVTIEPLPENYGAASFWEAQPRLEGVYADPRLPQLGWRFAGPLEGLGADSAGPEAYERWRLECAVPEGDDLLRDKSLLLEFGFEDLHGVDFHKGCYVGQEVTARSKYRGQVRKFIYQVRAQNGTLPEPGTAVMHGETQAGEMRGRQGEIGLALLRVDEVERARAANKMLQAGTAILKTTLPQWVTQAPLAAAE